jgi:hypothetical protein
MVVWAELEETTKRQLGRAITCQLKAALAFADCSDTLLHRYRDTEWH